MTKRIESDEIACGVPIWSEPYFAKNTHGCDCKPKCEKYLTLDATTRHQGPHSLIGSDWGAESLEACKEQVTSQEPGSLCSQVPEATCGMSQVRHLYQVNRVKESC